MPEPGATVETQRAFIAEAAERAAAYAGHVLSYADLRDDAGLARSVRLMTQAAVRAAETLPGFAEAARQQAALRTAARAVAE